MPSPEANCEVDLVRWLTFHDSTVRVEPVSSDTPIDRPDLASLLRSVSIPRMVDYGVSLSEAQEFAQLVRLGREWQDAAMELADRRVQSAEVGSEEGMRALASTELRTASVLRLIGQLAFLEDSDQKRATYRLAVEEFESSLRLGHDHVQGISIENGSLGCWLFEPPDIAPRPTVLIWGGTSGWGPVYYPVVAGLNELGFAVGLVELPGQGSPRLEYGARLRLNFSESVSSLMDAITSMSNSSGKFAVVGHSMGGMLAALVASHDERVSACVVNGGVASPASLVEQYPRQGALWKSMLGVEDDTKLRSALIEFENKFYLSKMGCPMLILYGGHDPLVSRSDIAAFCSVTTSLDRTVAEFPGGEHCLYNRADERNALIAGWLHAHLMRKRRATY